MAERYDNIDRQILDGIDTVRLEWGCCSAGLLASRLRLPRGTVVSRCHELRAKGLIDWNDAHGSLRVVETHQRRLYELLLLRAIEEQATIPDHEMDEAFVWLWCQEVVALATAAAWPELAGERAVAPGEPEPTSTPVAASADDLRCVPCDRTFERPQALAGHLRSSKDHAARVAALAGDAKHAEMALA